MSIPALGCGGVKGGGGKVTKGVLGGNPWVGGGDGKIIPPVGLRDLPTKGDGGVVAPKHCGDHLHFRILEAFLSSPFHSEHFEYTQVR